MTGLHVSKTCSVYLRVCIIEFDHPWCTFAAGSAASRLVCGVGCLQPSGKNKGNWRPDDAAHQKELQHRTYVLVAGFAITKRENMQVTMQSHDISRSSSKEEWAFEMTCSP